MAVQIFMKASDIKGGSKDSKHDAWIDIASLHAGVRQDVSNDVLKSTEGAGRPEFSRIKVRKKSDISSPYLYVACAEGKRIPEIVIEVCDSSGEKEVLVKYICKNCLITDAHLNTEAQGDAGDAGKAQDPFEEVAFGFSWVHYSVKGGADSKYNLEKNQPE
ncbi:MAG: type VI secretion system tube protein Hcp [Candidatus Thiodiazotropha sp.]|jgi:type VI secretion system secreted protein Hcp